METAILDSGCSSHFLSSTSLATNLLPNTSTHVQLPDGSTVSTSHSATVPLHIDLPAAATDAHVIPKLQHSLLSIGQLCDSGCIAIFDSTKVAIEYNNNTVIIGHRSPTTNLWHIDLPHQNHHIPSYINNAFRPKSTIADRIAYYHA